MMPRQQSVQTGQIGSLVTEKSDLKRSYQPVQFLVKPWMARTTDESEGNKVACKL